MRSSFILIFTRAMRLSKTYSFSGNVVRKSRPRTQYFVLISMFLAPVSLYNGFSYRAYLSCFVERQDRQNLSFGAKMSRSKYSILCGRNVAHEGIDQQWITKAVGPKHQFSFYYFFYKNDKGIWLKLSKKKGGVKECYHNIAPPFFESNTCKYRDDNDMKYFIRPFCMSKCSISISNDATSFNTKMFV